MLSLLQNQIGAWLKLRRRKDNFGQFKTQLNALEKVLFGALKRLHEEGAKLNPRQHSSAIYSECRKNDQRAVWLLRVWRYYRTKFDQRDDELLGPTLSAADEVVWSCYRQVFQQANLIDPSIMQQPVPLAYIEPLYTPQAIPRDDPPGDLESNIDVDFLKKFLAKLPIPIVSLPPACIQAPWWLIYLGHEIGHHLQYDLLPAWQLVIMFRNLLENTVRAHSTAVDTEKAAERWANWSKEIFADAISVCLMGPWAAWAMNELEVHDDKNRLKSLNNYPSPVVRMMLLKTIVEQLQTGSPELLDELSQTTALPDQPILFLNKDLRSEAAADLTLVPPVVNATLRTPLCEMDTMAGLCSWQSNSFAAYGTVDYWRDGLLGRKAIIPEKSLRTPRLIASAGVAAWTEVMVIDNEAEREAQRNKLVEKLLKNITENREEGTRTAEVSSIEATRNFGNQLADWLLQINPEELTP